MKIRKLQALSLSLMVGAVTYMPGVAHATNGARFTSLSAEYFEGNTDDFYQPDGHIDDLEVSFTETGVGNSKTSDITVTARREVSVTCISAGRQYLVNSTEPLEYRFSDGESPDGSAEFSTDENGHLTGTVQIYTVLEADICPKDPNVTDDGTSVDDEAAVYAVKDYSLTYTNVTVTDNENGGATATIDRVEPGYTDPTLIRFGIYGPLFGFFCTIEDAGSGNCHSD